MQPDETKFGTAPKKHKGNLAEPPPLKQWDYVAFKMIQDELAPKGFKDLKGQWKGKTVSNIPFLPKQTVTRCQNITAQLVRAYRQEVKAHIEKLIHICREYKAESSKKIVLECKFWQIRKRRRLEAQFEIANAQMVSLSQLLENLDNIKVPTK